MVAGDAGIGKTRMLREFSATARDRGTLTLWGSSFEGDWHPPYGPWVEALGEAVRSVERPRLHGARPRRAGAGKAGTGAGRRARRGAGTVAALSPEEERFRLYDAVARFLVAVARQQPTVLILDDLHWTDRDSLQLLAYCGRGHRWHRSRARRRAAADRRRPRRLARRRHPRRGVVPAGAGARGRAAAGRRGGEHHAALGALDEAGAEPRASAEFLAGAVRRLRDGGAPPEVCERFVQRGLELVGDARDLTWARLALLRDRFETVSTGLVCATRWTGYDPETVRLARAVGDEDDYAHTIEPFEWRTVEQTAAVLALARRWRRPAAVIRALNVACRDALFLHGAFADALARGEELLEVARSYGSLPGQAEAVAAIAAARRASADLPLAEQTAEWAAELVAGLHPDHRLHVIVEVPLASMLAYYLDGDWAGIARKAAERAAAPAVGRSGLLGLHVGACAALAYARDGDQESAERLLGAIVPVLERMEPTMHHHTLSVHYCSVAAWELDSPRWADRISDLVGGLVAAGAGDSLMASHSLCQARMAALAGRAGTGGRGVRAGPPGPGRERPPAAAGDHRLRRGTHAGARRIGRRRPDRRAARRRPGRLPGTRHGRLPAARGRPGRATAGSWPSTRRPHPARGRGAQADQRGQHHQADRRGADRQPRHRRAAHHQPLPQDRRPRPRGRHRIRAPPGRRRARLREGFPSNARSSGRGGPAMRPAGARGTMRTGSTRDEEAGHGSGQLQRAPVEGVELEYEVEGAGEPVVLIHAGVAAGWFRPLLREPALAGHYRLVRYHRVGYAGSGRVAGPVSIERQAAHCRALMRHLGIEQAHVVGHSSSANMALQLALDAPDAVRSLALLEPALLAVPTGPYGPEAIERYRAGDKAGAVDTWMRGVCGPAYAEVLERTIPGAFEEAVADADTFFGQELPAVRSWSFGPEEAARVTQPALAVLGAESKHVTPVFDQRHELLLAWLPAVESFVLPGATHLLHLQNPGGMAAGLAGFFARHPLPAAADAAGAAR